MTNEELIKYWIDSSEENHTSMRNVFNSGEYAWALFIGHLCIEKLLKACYVKNVEPVVPRIHDLYKLAVKCNLELTNEQKDALQYVTLFNIEARYEEYKQEFNKKCTREFAEENMIKIEGLKKWLLEKIRS